MIFLYIRAILFYLFLGFTLVILLPFLLLILPLPPLVSLRLGGMWSAVNLWALKMICGVRVRFIGTEHISKTPVLYVSKHQSALETLALATIINNSACVVKKSLFHIPIFGWFLWRSGMIGINRNKGRKSLQKMRADSHHAIKQGRNVAIFPEGTRSKVGAKPNYKVGAYEMYKALHVPTVPIALNTGLYWPRNQFIKTAGTATIAFLPPIPTGLSKEEFMHTMQHRIETQTHILCDVSHV